MNVTFNRDVLEGKWKQMRGRVRKQWGRLTDSQLDQIRGRYDELTGLIQETYGYTIEKTRQEVDEFIRKLNQHSE